LKVLNIISIAFQLFIIFFLLLPFFNTFFSLLVPRKKLKKNFDKKYDFAAVITAYKDIDIAIPCVDSILKQKYENYIIYLVADQCDINKIDIKNDKLVVLNPEEKLGSKVKSIKYAINNFKRKHEAIIVFDPDNLAHPHMFAKMNLYFNNGYKAVQGRRTAKNVDTVYACLDAMGEYYYNYVTKYAPYNLRSSSPIAGSGMALDYDIYVNHLNDQEISSNINKVIVAEDKLLQAEIVAKGHQIAFARDAIIYDEKVSSGSQVERQRTRWINSYFKYSIKAIEIIIQGILNFSWNQFLFGLNIFLPPLFLLVLTSGFFFVLNFFVDKEMFLVWLCAIVIFFLNFNIALLLSNIEKEIWKSMWGIPLFMFNQIMALLKIKRSNKEFMETEHTQLLTIDDVLKQKGIENSTGKIKILNTIRQGSFGGGETYLFNLVTGIDKNKFEPVVLSFSEGAMVDELKKKGIKTYVVKTNKPFDFSIYAQVKRIMENECIDLLHIHGTRAGSNSILQALKINLTSIYTVHGWSFHTGLSSLVLNIRTLSEKLIIRKSDLVICGSQDNLSTGRNLVPGANFRLIYNSINSDLYSPDNNVKNIREELGYTENDVIVLFIARLTYQKDPLTFVNSAKIVLDKIPDAKFLIIGEGELKNNCITLSETLNIKDKIKFLPFRQDVKNILYSTDIFVLPSYWEVVPLALLEAMSMQKACIATNIQGTNEALRDGFNGYLFPVGNFVELADKIISLINDKSLREKFGKEARNTVVRQFDLKKLIKENEEVYSYMGRF
jgi:glycosyltransferase involved in cell wall biosynthesis/cellulose synthase/poly-beta-1,6-N-acetylglucosamine synthase-like glycosyltransferase